MDKQLNVSHGIVIQNLPEDMKWDAVKSLEETFLILPSSVLSVTISKFGVNIIFERYADFFKVITKRILVINSAKYHIYPMVTDMTVIRAGPFIDERTLKCLMSNIAPVLSVYREEDLKGGRTNNYRAIMNHPEIYDFIKLWPRNQILGISDISFPITFFCRLCRQNGHTRHQCDEIQQISCSNEKSYKLKFQEEETTIDRKDFEHSPKQNTDRKSNVIVESFKEILGVPYHCDESIESNQKETSTPHCDESIGSKQNERSIPHSDESIESKQKERSIPHSEIKVSQPTLFKIKNGKSEIKPLQVKHEEESYEEILRVPSHCDESIESLEKDKSLPFCNAKVSQPILIKIKDEKCETKPLQSKREDTDQSKRPEENPCSNNSTFTIQTNIKIPPQRNKSDSSSSKVSKTPHTNVNSPKNVSSSCKKSKKHKKIRFSKLIPPELHIIVSPLKELILNIVNEVCSKTIYSKAKLYQYGVTALLHHLNNVVKFNVKEITTRTSQERRFIFWIDSMLTKITEEHSKIKLEGNYLCSSSNLKLESYNNTQDMAYLPKCSMINNDLKNDTLKTNYLKEGIKMFTEQTDKHEHTKAKMHHHESFQNKDTLNDIQKKKDKSLKNITRICQDVNLESVITNIKLNLKKNEEHCPGESILNKKRHANQTGKPNVRRNKKHCGNKDACGAGIQVTNLELQKNKKSSAMNEACYKKNVSDLEAQTDVQNQKCCVVQRVSVEEISTYSAINLEGHNDRIKNSMKEVCIEKGVQYPVANIDVQKSQKIRAVKMVTKREINTYPAINMNEPNDNSRRSKKEFCIEKGVQYPVARMDVQNNQKSCTVKRVANEKIPSYSAINLDGHNDKIKNSMKEVCIEKGVQYPGAKMDVQKSQKNCIVKRVSKEKMNICPSINMDEHNNNVRCSIKEFCVEKGVRYPGAKMDIQKNQKSCAVKMVAKEKINAYPVINMAEQNDNGRCLIKELCVEKCVQYPGAQMAVQKSQQSCIVQKVAKEKINIYPTINMSEYKDNVRRSIKEFCVEKGVQYPGAKMDVPKNQKVAVLEDKRGVFIGKGTFYQATKTNVQKDSRPTTSPKAGQKMQPKKGKLYAKYSQGLLSAIRCSKGILKPYELKMFLMHVKGKTHVRQMAKNYSLEINKLVEQLEAIVSKHYRGFRVAAPTSKEIAWIKELIERLKAHETCETCQR